MKKPIAYNNGTVTAYGAKSGSYLEVANTAANFGIGIGGKTWYNAPDPDSQYVIFSDTYNHGYGVVGDGRPMFWSTGTKSDASLLTIVNGLPDRRNSDKFTVAADAIAWINGSTKYFFLDYAPPYVAGLYKTTYSGYFGSTVGGVDNVNWFNTATPGTFGTNPATEVQTTTISEPGSDDGSSFSCQWLGYFKPTTTEVYTFYTASDDSSFMWIGANAQSGYSVANATVNNSGLHGSIEKSGSISLTAGTYYPIRIQFGEYTGGDFLTFNYSTPSLTKTTNVTGLVFYNTTTNNF
jgi:hypothetical protein